MAKQSSAEAGLIQNSVEAKFWEEGFLYGYDIGFDHKDELKYERDQLRAEVDHLKEAISYLPKIPTQLYEKRLAQECNKLKAQCEKLVGALEDLMFYSSCGACEENYSVRSNALAEYRKSI